MKRETFIISGTLDSLNKYFGTANHNKFMGNSIKQRNTKKAQAAFEDYDGVLPLHANFHFHWHKSNRKSDPDNIASAIKFIFDGMQEAGIMLNDNWEAIESIHHYFYSDVPKDFEYVEVEVTWDAENLF